MTLVRIEGVAFNPEQVCLVRQADHNMQGWATEVILASGSQLLKSAQVDVERLLQGGPAFSAREAPTLP